MDKFLTDVENILSSGFKLDAELVKAKKSFMQSNFLEFSQSEVRIAFKQLANPSLKLQFQQFFYNDEDKHPRVWPKIEEEKI